LAFRSKFSAGVAAIAAALPLLAASPTRAQEIPSLFSDTEVEQAIRMFCTPVWIAAGLDPKNIHVVLVNSHDLQAFVAGGQNIFIYTGLLAKTDDPLQIAGVVAHETGHIAGAHLARSDEDMSDASYTMLLATILGAAAAVGSRDPGAMGGALGIGEDMGMRSYLAFSRTKEASADEAGMTYLEKAHLSPRGLLEFMKKIQVEDGTPLTGDAKYLVDHPPTPDRVQAMIQGVGRSRYADAPIPPEWKEPYVRMKAKLIGYLEPEYALKRYSRADTSVAGRYGRSIALWRQGQIEPALTLIDTLIGEQPNDPYFLQAKAQMLFERGRVAESIEPFRKAAAFAPKDTDEIPTEYAQALLESENPALLETAVQQLKIAEAVDPRNSSVHHFLGIAYGRQGKEAVAKVELAEQAILEGRTKAGRRMAQDAMRLLPAGSREWLRAQDLVAATPPKQNHVDSDGNGVHFSVGPTSNSSLSTRGFAEKP
jgi:predicted Zn-dependent protease